MRGIKQLRPVMFTDTENIQVSLAGELNRLQQVLHTLDRTEVRPVVGSEMAAAKLSMPIFTFGILRVPFLFLYSETDSTAVSKLR